MVHEVLMFLKDWDGLRCAVVRDRPYAEVINSARRDLDLTMNGGGGTGDPGYLGRCEERCDEFENIISRVTTKERYM